LKIKAVRSEKDFFALETTWKELHSAGAVKDITTTWEWMSTWWKVFREGRNLAVLVAHDGERPIGIAPFVQRRVRHFGLLPHRRLEFMASGEDKKDEICSDYLDFIVRPEHEEAFLDSVLDFLVHSGVFKWDELVLPQVRLDSPTCSFLREAAARYGLLAEETERSLCPIARLPASKADYLRHLGKSTRVSLKHSRNRLMRIGSLSFKVARTAAEIREAWKILIALHQKRWTDKGYPGVFSSKKFTAFHEEMAALARKKGWLWLATLFLNDEPIASFYGFLFNDKIYAYQSGVKEKVPGARNVSVGLVCDAMAIEHAITAGISEFDFLAGTSLHKCRLAKQSHTIITLRIGKPTWKETAYRGAWKLKKKASSLVHGKKIQILG